MKRSTINFIIDTIAFVCFMFLTSTGILIRYILPKGNGSYLTIWGMDRHEWGGIHFWVAIIFLAMILIHIMLHWSWIIAIIKGKVEKRADIRLIVVIVAFLTMLVISVAPLIVPASGNREGGGRRGKGNSSHETRNSR